MKTVYTQKWKKIVEFSRTDVWTEFVFGINLNQTGHKVGNCEPDDPEKDSMKYTVST
jgi:hypothetical protein